MPWLRSGSVSCTLNSTTVTGTGTGFVANARVGDAFLGPDGRWYEVANIASDTALSILPAYLGATVSAGAYALAPMQGYVKDSADQLRTLVNKFGTLAASGSLNALAGVQGTAGSIPYFTAADTMGLLKITTTAQDSTAGSITKVGDFGLGGTNGAPFVTNLYDGKAFEAVAFSTGASGAQTSFGCALRIHGSANEWRNILQFGVSGELNWTTVTNPSSGGTWRNYTIFHSGLAAADYIAITLQNSYSAQTGRRNGYRLYLGMVEVKINVNFPSGYADGATVATLPAGFRPATPFVEPATNGCRVLVGVDGSLGLFGGVAGSYSSFSLWFKPA